MSNLAVKENEMIESRDIRQQMIDKVSVLDKVKKLVLLPNTELMTTKMVAEWYEVDFKTVSKIIDRNREELSENGFKFMKYAEIKEILNSDIMSQLKVSRQGTNVFSKRATLNIGMLLRDSEVAKRLRAALLDQQEVTSDEQKTLHINKEDQLLLSIIKAANPAERATYLSEYDEYKNRHIKQLESTIEQQKPKVETHDKIVDASNLVSIKMVGKNIGIGEKKIFEFLRCVGIIYREGKTNIPKQDYINRGFFDVKVKPVTLPNGDTMNQYTTKVTGRGEVYILNIAEKYGGAKEINKLKLEEIAEHIKNYNT